MSESLPTSKPPWVLLDIIAVDPARRVQCQCKGCGHSIYAAIHMVRLPGGEFQCWGSDCYAREAGLAGVSDMKPLYSGFGGRKLTDQEREWLTNNRERLIAEFKAQHAEKLRKEEETRQAAEARKTQAEAQIKANPVEAFLAVTATSAPTPHTQPIRPRPLPSVKSPPVDYTRPQAREPMHDSCYREIRERKVREWLRNGIDLTRAFHFNSLVENCLLDYSRGHGRRTSD